MMKVLLNIKKETWFLRRESSFKYFELILKKKISFIKKVSLYLKLKDH
jgi:hypothetical protein